MQLLRERGLPFVGGPTLNVYNHETLRLLCEDGLERLVLGVEQGRADSTSFAQVACRCPNSRSRSGADYRSRTRRAASPRVRSISRKDDCGFRCIDYPDGLPLASREGQPFLIINGVQVQTAGHSDLGPELDELRTAGIGLLRVYPQAEGTAEVVARFRTALQLGITPPRVGEENGYWYGAAGMQLVETPQAPAER